MKKWRSMDLFGSVENLFMGHHSSTSPDSSTKTKSFRQRLSSLSVKDDSALHRNKDTWDGSSATKNTENQMIQRCVIVQRDDKGYGLTVSGDNPVFVQSVKSEGAAARCGVQEGDKILKVNGTLVTNRNHIDVVKLIKSGALVALTLLGKPPGNNLEKSATIITPQHPSPSSNRVTAPQPVDPEIDKELWQQKVHTTRAMFEQAREDLERLKRNYVKNPSEKLSVQLSEKERTVKKLEEQLTNITGTGNISPSTPLTPLPGISDADKSPMDVNTNISWTASLPSSVPIISDAGSLSDSPPISPSISPTPSHPSNRQDVDDSSSSSKVDSGIEDSLSLSNQANIITIDDEDMNSEEEILDGKSWVSSQRPISPFLHKLQKSETGDAGPFSDMIALEKKPAHLGIFLHYLISNSDPSPVFFYIISDMYSHAQGSSKDMRKWAYEIYSTFLTPNAPLSAGLGDNVITMIDSALTINSSKAINESGLRSVFEPARVAVRNIIQDLLADFRQKKDLGLGSIYGTHELRDDMDRQSENKMIEKYLFNHMSLLIGEDKSDREQAMGWALATFLRQVISGKLPHSGVMERVQSFVMKDKRSLKFPITKSKSKTIKSHQFTLQHYYMVTFCSHCSSLIWGVGYQGYQCNNCEINVHRQCVDDLVEVCTGKHKKREKRASSMIPVIPSIRKFSNPNPSAGSSFTTVNEALREAAAVAADGKGNEIQVQPIKRDEEAEFAGLPAGHSVKSIIHRYEKPSPDQPGGSEEDELDEKDTKDKSKKKKDIGRSESMKSRNDKKDRDKKRSKSDVDVDDSTIKALNQSGSSSTSSLGVDNHIEGMEDNMYAEIQNEQTDSDLDVDNDLPSLISVVGEDVLKKLKPKEKKRQEVLNELIHTERAHVRNLKILDRLFFRPMAAEAGNIDLAKQLLPNIHQMIRLHSALNNGLKSRRKENPVIGEVGDLFLKRFDGEEGEMFKKGCAIFCEGQSFALDALKKQQRKEQRLSQFLNDAESNPLCRRLQLKDLVPSQFQRLTKYPLLIENLLKYTSTNTDEHKNLTLALKKTKEILAKVNQSVKDFENFYRLKILQKKMEKKIPQDNQEIKRRQVNEDMKNLDLSQHKLVYEGELTWRLRPNRLIDLHVILLEDILVLLQKQDDKLILKCQSTNVHTTSDPMRSESGRGSDIGKGYTHSPILKLQNLLSRNVATDKKAFFVINTSEAGPQIYELVAANQDGRKKWHNHINTWADTCKSTKKSQKPPTPTKTTGGEITTPQPEEITEVRDRIHVRAPENLSRADTNTHDTVPQSGASQIETADVRSEPELVQPGEIKVSGLVVAQSKAVLTPLANAGRASGINVPIPLSQLKDMAAKMNSILTNLLSAVGSTEEEKVKLRIELKVAQEQLNILREVQRSAIEAEHSSHSRPASMVSVASSVSEQGDTTDQLTEEEDDTAQESDQEMIVMEYLQQIECEHPEQDLDTDPESDQTQEHDSSMQPDEENCGEISVVEEMEECQFDQIEVKSFQPDNNSEPSQPGNINDHMTGDDDHMTGDDQLTDHVTGDDQLTDHVTGDDQLTDHVTGDDLVTDHVINSDIGEASDNSSDTILLNQSECLMDTSSHSNEETVDEDQNDKDKPLETSLSNYGALHPGILDSIEGAIYSDSDSTITPVPYFSELENDPMAKSDATLVGSINSILSDSEISQDASNYCDVSCDSQRTNEKAEESNKSDPPNQTEGIEI